ncbi:PKD domain-containing protein [Chitinophaga arvensicola]|uniref:Gliding motility-associated C-terminal domain-containing protein n=1 Tax=Chitinophaga arvensicola TaxID=29529 RepID=A0A1I0QU71_9BACT|nr:PKD domain-containing protein [Chitinophaga arvensicola]SEW30931.1 gliding motility-associated C-terminal domain-containing protein [Chitinophaga arvensicola]
MKSLQYYLRIVIRHIFYGLLPVMALAMSAHAQSVTINADKRAGCPPFLVNFTATLDAGYQKMEWDFGLGANITNDLAPSKTFQDPGIYHVKLTATYGPGNVIVRQIDIQVYNKPTVNFTMGGLTGCAPFSSTFQDQSTPGDGTIRDITWDFGDGSGATGPNVTHVYTNAGTNNVISAVTNSYGCTNFKGPVPIKVEKAPTPVFSADKTQSCVTPFTVNFFNNTVNNSPDPVTYTWDYGDGSTGQTNQHTYTKEGRYTVKLTATTPGGCSTPLVKTEYIIIEKVKPAFTYSSLCVDQPVTFTNTTQPTPDQVTWAFPDGTTQTSTDAVKQFSAPGDYIVKMQATLGTCMEEIQQTIHVNPSPQIDPVATPISACNTPFTTQFNAQSTGATSWLWNFGDGTTSMLENPSHTYTREGIYDISLVATNASGCSKTVNKPRYISIAKPNLSIYRSIQEGCIPLPVDFYVELDITDPIVSYAWNFGDGATSTDARPHHVFTAQGTYTVSITVTTAGGCTATGTTIIMAGTKPVVDFVATPLKSCAKDPVQFTNLSVPRGTSWTWIFVQDNSTSTDENPNHTFNEIGNHDIILEVNNNGCVEQLIKRNYIQIIPPIARFETAPDCVNPYHRKFTDNSTFGPIPTPVKTWLWEFGENGATSTDQNPDFTYLTTGLKQVRLTIDNGICTSTTTQSVNIIDEKPVISSDKPRICKGEAINISLGPINNANVNEYNWDWGDGSPVQNIPAYNFDPTKGISHTYNKTGTFTIKLSITDKNSCTRDAPPISIDVNGTDPDFDFTGKRCKDEIFSFTDKSTASAGNQILNWEWDFGDQTAKENYTTQPVGIKHTYTNANDYTVVLTVTDKFSCVAKATQVIRFDRVKADFIVPSNVACLDKSFTFVDQSEGNVTSYTWDFGDKTTGTGNQPVKVYSAPGKYNVVLKVITAAGCTDEITKTNLITVPDPKASFTIPANLDLCPPVKVLFTNTSTDFVNSHWDFGDNGTSSKNDPDVHIYARAKTYDVILTVYAEGGCSSTTTLPITIKGPDGTMKTTPTQGCVPLTVSVTATSTKTDTYMWDFDDGTVLTSKTPVSPAHTYVKSGIYYPRVSLLDDQGCVVKADGNDKIIVDKTTADFTTDDFQVCGGGLVTFTNKSKTLTKDSLALDFTNAWDFGVPGNPDNNATTFNGSFNYPQPGTTNVKLTVTSAYGCIDEKILPVVIPPQPVAVIAPILPLCVSGKFQLSGSDTRNLTGTKWLWQVGTDKTYTDRVPPEIALNSPGTVPVTLTITNADGSCPSVTTANMVINPSPILNPSPMESKICRGTVLQLQANTTTNVMVDWTNYNISDPASVSPQVKPDIDTVYKVTATNEYGCTNKGEVRVSVTQPFHVYAQDAEICAGESVQMNAGGALRYQWIPARGLNRADIQRPTSTPDGNITYQVVGYDNSNCFTDTALARVYVRSAPVVNAGPDMVIATGSVIPLPVTGSADIIKTEWTPVKGLSCYDCLTPTATPTDDITYHVKVTNQFGCESSDDITIKLVCNEGNVFIPNTFSPNGDGQNDIFYIRGQGMQTIRVFRIFNRWGQLVFERTGSSTNDPSKGWDGRFKGVILNPDVFVYYVELVCDKGAVNLLKGNVTLIR